MNRLRWKAALGVTACTALVFPACQEARQTGAQPAASATSSATPSAAPSAAPPAKRSNDWALSSDCSGSSSDATPLTAKITIADDGTATGTLRHGEAKPMACSGSLVDGSLRLEARSLTERVLVIADPKGQGEGARFTGSLVAAAVDGAWSKRCTADFTRSEPTAPRVERGTAP